MRKHAASSNPRAAYQRRRKPQKPSATVIADVIVLNGTDVHETAADITIEDYKGNPRTRFALIAVTESHRVIELHFSAAQFAGFTQNVNALHHEL